MFWTLIFWTVLSKLDEGALCFEGMVAFKIGSMVDLASSSLGGLSLACVTHLVPLTSSLGCKT